MAQAQAAMGRAAQPALGYVAICRGLLQRVAEYCAAKCPPGVHRKAFNAFDHN